MAFDSEAIVSEVIELTKRLVACFPVYESDGIAEAQRIVCEQLKAVDGMDVIVDEYSADSIKHLDGNINVCDFQDIYANYENVPKINVYGIREGREPTLILNGHIDVDMAGSTKEQNDELRAIIADDRIFGRGTTDMLCGLSCMIICLKHFLKHHKINNKIVFMSVCDEEIGGNGTLRSLRQLETGHVFRCKESDSPYASDCTAGVTHINSVSTSNSEGSDGISACAASTVPLAIIAEPTECKYCIRSLGFLPFRVALKGRASHMGAATNDGAFFKLLQIQYVVETLRAILKNQYMTEDDANLMKFNVGEIHGGCDSAIPIERLDVGITIAYPDSISADTLKNCIIDAFKRHISESDFEIAFSDLSFDGVTFPPSRIDEICKSAGVSPDIFHSPSDARLFQKHNISAILFGPGSIRQAHYRYEYIYINEIRKYVTCFIDVLSGFCQA